MKTHKTILAAALVGVCALLVIAWNPSSQNFNGNQFTAPNFVINIKSGVLLTNPVAWTSFTVNSTNPGSFFGGGIWVTGNVVQATGSNYYGGGVGISNLVMTLNTNQSGAAFKVLDIYGATPFYQTNITAALTLASFDTTGCTQDKVYGFLFRVTANGNYLITGPNGSLGPGRVAPATFYSTNNQAIMGQVTLQPGIFTNIDWSGH